MRDAKGDWVTYHAQHKWSETLALWQQLYCCITDRVVLFPKAFPYTVDFFKDSLKKLHPKSRMFSDCTVFIKEANFISPKTTNLWKCKTLGIMICNTQVFATQQTRLFLLLALNFLLYFSKYICLICYNLDMSFRNRVLFCLIPLLVIIMTWYQLQGCVYFQCKEITESHQAQATHDVSLQLQISYNFNYDPLCFSSFIIFQMTLSKQLRLSWS